MRKTLHILPQRLAALAHCATIHFRVRDALRSIQNARLDERTINSTTTKIVELLSENETVPYRQIEKMLMTPQHPITSIRLTVKLLWERGTLTYVNNSEGWNHEVRTFGLTSKLYPHFDVAFDRHYASRKLILEYFDKYGPASIKDAMWWSGLSRSAVVSAINNSSRQFIEIQTIWCESPLYMYADQAEEIRATKSSLELSGLNMLAHEDVALKAYFESRARYLGRLPQKEVFNQIGEALPTIMLDGQIIGRWRWNPDTDRVEYTIFDKYCNAKPYEAARTQADQLTGWLRQGLYRG